MDNFHLILVSLLYIVIVFVCGKTMCLSQLSLSEVQGYEKKLFGATRISAIAKWDTC